METSRSLTSEACPRVLGTIPAIINFAKVPPESVLQAGFHGPSSFSFHGTRRKDIAALEVYIVEFEGVVRRDTFYQLLRAHGYKGAPAQCAPLFSRIFQRVSSTSRVYPWPLLFLGNIWTVPRETGIYATCLVPGPDEMMNRKERLGQYEIPHILPHKIYYALLAA